jgi:hypothetical protein
VVIKFAAGAPAIQQEKWQRKAEGVVKRQELQSQAVDVLLLLVVTTVCSQESALVRF